MRKDVAVLGAGIVGVSAALHLQARGRSVVLVDRRDPGEETSHGNAGLIERSSVIPFSFPRSPAKILRYALNRSSDVHAHWPFVLSIMPFLWRFWRESAPARLRQAALDMLPLIERSVAEHEYLMSEARILPQLSRTGWLQAYRDPRSFEAARAEVASLEEFGLDHAILDGSGLRRLEPSLSEALIGAVHWRDPAASRDPGALVKAYAALFIARGGHIVRGDARTLVAEQAGWRVTGAEGPVVASDVVVALGPWSTDLARPLGYRFPMAVKRGYHMHYRLAEGASLDRPILDADRGYVLAPMARGIRLTTGAELAPRDHAQTPVQLAAVEPHARALLPLGDRLDPAPWMGARPCLPDMRPVIGPGTRHKGLWFAFGHNHHGLTLGPATGRLLAEMMTGAAPFADPRPYRADRFA